MGDNYTYFKANGIPYRVSNYGSLFEMDAEKYVRGKGFVGGNLSEAIYEGEILTEEEFKTYLVKYLAKKPKA